VATIYDVVKETIRTHHTLVHVFHAYASGDIAWMAHALSHCTPVRYGRIASISAAYDATQFGDSIYPVYASTFQMLVHSDPTDAGLNTTQAGATTLELRISYQATLLPFHPVFSIFP
jgi:hypothetical protein